MPIGLKPRLFRYRISHMAMRTLISPWRGLILLFAVTGPFAIAQTDERWVPTWTTALFRPAPGSPAPVGQTVTAAQQALRGFNNQTVRMIVPVSIGGHQVRIQFSNTYGNSPLTVGAAHVALHGKQSAIVAGSDRSLLFGGRQEIVLPPGATALSDAVSLDVPALSELAVSVFVRGATGVPSFHAGGLHTTYTSKQGDASSQPALEDAVTTQSWYWLSGVYVLAPANATAVLAFGDSITDGARSTLDTNSSWPSRLAARMADNRQTSNVAVINEGIGGNRILRDGVATSALGRFDEDVLSQAGVTWVIFLEGINDIGRGLGPGADPADSVTAEDLIGGMRQFVERAHLHGLRVMGATMTPFSGARYYSEKGEAVRESVNEWILKKGSFDAVTDFNAVTRDPEHPLQFRPDFDSGDHLHPDDAGYRAMAEAIDITVFARP
jgi:lysophospholipase L1-like esterase